MSNERIRKLAFAGAIAALYAALTMALSFIGYGPVQFRVAEALCVLPFFFPFSIWGLFAGCVIANLMSPFPLDIAVGPLATLLAALLTMLAGKLGRGGIPARVLACLPPVVINAIFIGALIAYYMVGAGDSGAFFSAFLVSGLQVGAGELAVMYIIGLPLLIYLPKMHLFEKFGFEP